MEAWMAGGAGFFWRYHAVRRVPGSVNNDWGVRGSGRWPLHVISRIPQSEQDPVVEHGDLQSHQ